MGKRNKYKKNKKNNMNENQLPQEPLGTEPADIMQETGAMGEDTVTKELSLEDIFTIAYENYQKQASEQKEPILSRREFRIEKWSDTEKIKEFISKDAFARFLALQNLCEPVKQENTQPVTMTENEEPQKNTETEERAGGVVEQEQRETDTVHTAIEHPHIEHREETGDVIVGEKELTRSEVTMEFTDYEDAEYTELAAPVTTGMRETVLSPIKEEPDTQTILSDPALLKKVRRSLYLDENDTALDGEIYHMSADEIFEQLVRVEGVARKLPAIVEAAKAVYQKNQADISNERLHELLYTALHVIKKLGHFEFGKEFEEYIMEQIHITEDELRMLSLPSGAGGFETLLFGLREEDGGMTVYRLLNVTYEEACRLIMKLEHDSVEHNVNPLMYLQAYGVSVEKTGDELTPAFIFELSSSHLLVGDTGK